MRKLIFLLTMVVLAAAAAQAQQVFTIVDTVIVENTKTKIASEGIEAIIEKYKIEFAQEQVDQDTLIMYNETKALINYFERGVYQYKLFFARHDTLNYTKVKTEEYLIPNGNVIAFDYFLDGDTTQTGLIHEYKYYENRINKLVNDSIIDAELAKEAFANLKNKQFELLNRYNKIRAIKQTD